MLGDIPLMNAMFFPHSFTDIRRGFPGPEVLKERDQGNISFVVSNNSRNKQPLSLQKTNNRFGIFKTQVGKFDCIYNVLGDEIIGVFF